MIVSGGWGPGEVLGFDEVMEVESHHGASILSRRQRQVLGGCCVQVRKCSQTPNLLTPRSWTSQPPELRKMSVSSHLVYDVLLQYVEVGLQLGPGHESRHSGPPPQTALCSLAPELRGGSTVGKVEKGG